MFHPATSEPVNLLAEWRWLLGGHARLHGWSTAGDLFYADDRDRIWRLDAGAGECECVAASAEAFGEALSDPATAEELLLLPVVQEFEVARGPLGPGQCLGFTTLPVFGGGYGAANRFARAVAEHAAFTGDVHRQIRDLPDGARIQLRVIP